MSQRHPLPQAAKVQPLGPVASPTQRTSPPVADDFNKERLGAIVYEATYKRVPLLQALTKVVPAT